MSERNSLHTMLAAITEAESRGGKVLDLTLSGGRLGDIDLFRESPAIPACLEVLVADVFRRRRLVGRGTRLDIRLAAHQDHTPRLRCALRDDIPGLSGDGSSLFPLLAGVSTVSETLSEPCHGLARLIAEGLPGGAAPDLFSGDMGTTLWVDFPLPEQAMGLADLETWVPGWRRRSVWDESDLQRRLAGDTVLAALVTKTFLADAPRLLSGIREQITEGEAAELRRLCHSLKGAAANVGGGMLSEVARGAEWEAKLGNRNAVSAILPRLHWEFDRLAARCSMGEEA